jgi:XTP/dITP diphosphohydrolase
MTGRHKSSFGAAAVRLASANAGKLRELRAALPDWEIEPLDVDEYPPETGATYAENARLKARYGHRLAPVVLGEDSGIEVAAWGGVPGIHSARWSERPVEELLERLAGVEDRRARYVSALVCVLPDGSELEGTGTLPGRIAHEPRGSEGFGYDPIFVPDGEERTVAELGNAWKAQNSHRARAARALLENLRLTRAQEPPRERRAGGRTTS